MTFLRERKMYKRCQIQAETGNRERERENAQAPKAGS